MVVGRFHGVPDEKITDPFYFFFLLGGVEVGGGGGGAGLQTRGPSAY